MDANGRPGPPDEVRGPVQAAPVQVPVVQLPVVQSSCVMPPPPSLARRRFRILVVPALVLSALAWVALVVWGGGREMRRGLLTGGPALMSADGLAHAGAHAGHDAVLTGAHVAAPGMPTPDATVGAVGQPSMSMLGFDMGGLAPASVGYAGLFVWMWAVMVVAMMLPATLPSLRVYLAGDRTRRHCAGTAFLSGCLLTWVVAGLAVYGLLVLLDAALAGPAAESRFALGVGAACLLGAGVFQFSRAKERLLRHVRGPFNCGEGSLRAGLHHGRRCLASCGPYMLAVALIGMMSVFWMAVFAVVMLVEQLVEASSGRGMVVARATGAVTVLVAMGLLLSPTPLPLVA